MSFSITNELRSETTGATAPRRSDLGERMQRLRERAQCRAGIDIRDDSRLAWSWVTSDSRWPSFRIVDELALTQYMRDYTDWPGSLESVTRDIIIRRGDDRDGFIRAYVRDYIAPVVRIHRALRLGGRLPSGKDPWPWQRGVAD